VVGAHLLGGVMTSEGEVLLPEVLHLLPYTVLSRLTTGCVVV